MNPTTWLRSQRTARAPIPPTPATNPAPTTRAELARDGRPDPMVRCGCVARYSSCRCADGGR